MTMYKARWHQKGHDILTLYKQHVHLEIRMHHKWDFFLQLSLECFSHI